LPRTTSVFTALVRLGAVPAFAVIPAADYIGRRRLFLFAVIGLSLGTFLTAFSQTPLQFICCQVITRTFMLTAASVAFVFVTEEYPAEHRGWGIGMLAAIASTGYGLGALVFGAVESLPWGWRSLYAIGLTPVVLLLPFFRRNITETKRFTDHNAGRVHIAGTWAAIYRGSDRCWRWPSTIGRELWESSSSAALPVSGKRSCMHSSVISF
jgi:MFS family permease